MSNVQNYLFNTVYYSSNIIMTTYLKQTNFMLSTTDHKNYRTWYIVSKINTYLYISILEFFRRRNKSKDEQ